ncbi:hypothetical protein NKG94_14925 [Micromonospora sp. M12]
MLGDRWHRAPHPGHGEQDRVGDALRPRRVPAVRPLGGAAVRPVRVREYAIENEVNAPSYWAGSPEDYTRLVRAAAETIRATDPTARVVDSGISSVAYGMVSPTGCCAPVGCPRRSPPTRRTSSAASAPGASRSRR